MNAWLLEHGGLVLCIGARLIAAAWTAPAIGQPVIPWKIRMLWGIVLTISVAPTISQFMEPGSGTVVSLATPAALFSVLVCEVALGAAMGLSLGILLAAIQLAGRLIEALSGMSMASLWDPQSQTEGGPLTRLFWWTTLVVFLTAGGMHQVVAGILGSFQRLPPGQAVLDRSILDYVVDALAASFEIGLRAALPGILAFFAASWTLGMVQRSLPSLGSFQVGLGLKSIVGILVASLLLVTAPWVVGHGLETTLDNFQTLIDTLPASESADVS